jgi:hypothetical protein
MPIVATFNTTEETLTVRMPLVIRKRGGRRLVLAPGGSEPFFQRARIDNTVIKALARAFSWQKQLESGDFATIQDLATSKRVNPSYVSRMLRLTLLAPAIVESILDGRSEQMPTLDGLMRPFPLEWERQVRFF